MRAGSRVVATVTTVTLALSPAKLSAQGWIEITRPSPRPDGQVARISSEVRVTLDGRVARVEVEERFRNTGRMLAEGSYLYPLPGEAVFENFSLWMGDRELRGETLEADRARGVYEEIVRRRKDPALLTLAGHALIRAQVFPIQPGETRKVALRYTELLERAGDALRFRYAIGNRGGPDTFGFHLSLPSAAQYGTPYSPTQHLDVRHAADRIEIDLPADAAGDVEILVPIRHGLVGTTLLAHAPGGEDGYFMLVLAPPARSDEPAIPRDVTLVVDVSGSMSGVKIEQARAALRQALGTLGPADRFRLIAFSSTVRELGPGLTPATPQALDAARRFVDGLTAEGGTDIQSALDAALSRDGPTRSAGDTEGRLAIVLFLTDGMPSVGETAPDRIADRAGAELGSRRIFTVGIGHDVNTYLLDRLATEGRGSVEYVAPEASVETAVGAITTKIRYPALVDVRIERSPVPLADQSPARLPDLFYGEELVVLGRYAGHGTGDLVITGRRNGLIERFVARAAFPSLESGNAFIPRLWASRRVGDLTRQIRLEGATPDQVSQVRDLGLRYGILTAYTSYLVQEPEALAAVPAADRQTGRMAFEAAQASARLAEAKSLDAVAPTDGPAAAPAGPGRATQSVAGRIFVRKSGVWTDAAHRDSVQVTAVAPFSDAYFALVRALPELVPWLQAGDEVLVAGRRASIRIGASGVATWRSGQLEQLVRDFRGV